MFDCVMPTRNARNGHLFTRFGDLRLRNARHKTDDQPAGRKTCSCQDRREFQRRLPYLHHLDRCGEMLGPMLATIHNLHYLALLFDIAQRRRLNSGQLAKTRPAPGLSPFNLTRVAKLRRASGTEDRP